MTYINKYLQKTCSCDLQSLFTLSRNPEKEISESYAAYEHLKPYIDKKSISELHIFIGDGSLGMTGALFSFVTKGISVVIDPLLNLDKLTKWMLEHKVCRLHHFKEKFQSLDPIKLIGNEPYNLVLVHAHVDTSEVMKKYTNWKYCYVNPCCTPSKQKLTVEFQNQNNIEIVKCGLDTNILSDKNEIVIYKNNKLKD